MKNLVLASALSAAAGAIAAPALTGPVHYQVTRPHSLFGWMPATTTPATVTVSLGTVPMDFVITDLLNGCNYEWVLVVVNGQTVLSQPIHGFYAAPELHLNSGVFVRAGSAIEVHARGSSNATQPVTLSGYLQ